MIKNPAQRRRNKQRIVKIRAFVMAAYFRRSCLALPRPKDGKGRSARGNFTEFLHYVTSLSSNEHVGIGIEVRLHQVGPLVQKRFAVLRQVFCYIIDYQSDHCVKPLRGSGQKAVFGNGVGVHEPLILC